MINAKPGDLRKHDDGSLWITKVAIKRNDVTTMVDHVQQFYRNSESNYGWRSVPHCQVLEKSAKLNQQSAAKAGLDPRAIYERCNQQRRGASDA